MIKILRYAIILTIIATLAASVSLLPTTVNAQSFCPSGPVTGIMLCPPPRPNQLPVKGWNAEVDGVPAILKITSVDGAGKVQGNIFGGTLCTKGVLCVISGSFDAKSGTLSFLNTATSTKPGVLQYALQNYTGHLSMKVMLDVTDYTLAGTGTTLKPGPGKTFNWVAQTRCLVTGCIT
jgi:hypothetical protein